MSREASVAWSWRHAFALSDLPATTKAVLHTVGMFMNEVGESCYPSVADLCRYSGLDKKTVLKHLAVASEAGWLAISQHGFRGQKWKRNQYAPRWPERDLVSPCPPDDDGKGGGATPPPSEAEKVVDSTPEGGGTEGSKVVEHVHQDKTSPVNTPETSPIEREREREEDPKKIEAEGWALLKNWPGFDGMPKEPAMRIWRKLDAEERATARRRFLPWLTLLKAQRKAHAPAPSTYLTERLWQAVTDPADAPPAPVLAAPFGKAWGARRVTVLLGGSGPMPPAKGFSAKLIEEGGELGRREELSRQATYGFPEVNRMHELAADAKGWTLRPDMEPGEPVLALMAKCRVGSDEYQAWKALHDERGWPWLPDPGRQEWVYFPAGGPAGLETFEQTVRGTNDAQQAAE